MGFEQAHAYKQGLSIVTGITVIDMPSGHKVFIGVNEAVHKPTAEQSLLSEYQVRNFGIDLDSVPKKHGRKQRIKLEDEVIPLRTVGSLMTFTYRHPTEDEIEYIMNNKGTVNDLTEGDEP